MRRVGENPRNILLMGRALLGRSYKTSGGLAATITPERQSRQHGDPN
jgi:hypothetical protein